MVCNLFNFYDFYVKKHVEKLYMFNFLSCIGVFNLVFILMISYFQFHSLIQVDSVLFFFFPLCMALFFLSFFNFHFSINKFFKIIFKFIL